MGIYQSNHIQGKKGSQFSQRIRGLNLEQVLLVAIDAAKLHQKAMICNDDSLIGGQVEQRVYNKQ